LVQGNNSGLIDLGNDRSIVIHVDKHVPAAARPLAEVRADVQKRILDERVAAAEKKLSDDALARLDKGDAMSSVATSLGAQIKSVNEATRQSADVPAPLLTQAFLLPHPATGKAQFAAVDMKDGSYALLALDKVQDGDLSKVPPEQRESLRQQITQAYGSEATRELLDLLKANTKIKTNKSLM
jgi:peptidyl-prolyl cis-trans isomerase D